MDANIATNTDGLTRRLTQFAVDFRLRDAPPIVLENAKLAILDCIGVSVLANGHEIGAALRKFAKAHAGPGPCVFWGNELTTSARDAALLNGTLAHGLDFDDRNHSSTYSLAAPMAVAEEHGLSGERLLEAFIVGREVRNSLDALFAHRGSGIGPGAKGWHSNGVLGPIAAASAVARVLDLDFDRTLTALGLATASSGALTRDGGTMAKPFRTGHAASTGLTCVLLAESGFSADETPIEGRYGYLDALGPLSDELLPSLARELGTKFNLEDPIRGKPFACCSASHVGVEAMLRLVRRNPVKPDDVERIDCDLKPYPLVRSTPRRGFEGRFSMRFCIAVALIHGDVKPDDFIDENVSDATVQALMGKTQHSDSGTLVVSLTDGRRLEETLARPISLHRREEFEEKFRACVEGALPKGQVDRAIELLRGLEDLSSVTQLTVQLRPGA